MIDYATAAKADVPSGTSRELAERLAAVRAPGGRAAARRGRTARREARGATVEGTQVHSIRLPGFVLSTEVLFGLPDERLSIRHDAGGSCDAVRRGHAARGPRAGRPGRPDARARHAAARG